MRINKKGVSGVVVTLIVALIVAILIAGYFGLRQSVTDTGVPNTGAGACEVEPYIALTVLDPEAGAAVTPTGTYVRANDTYLGNVTLGSSGQKFSLGDSGEVLVFSANYIDKIVDFSKLGCGRNVVETNIYATDDSGIRVFSDVGLVVTDSSAGGATNQTKRSTVIDQEVKFTANSDQSSGDLIVVIEATNTSEVDDLILSGADKVDVPEFYSNVGAGSVAKAYRVPALIDGDSKTYNLKITPESGQTIGATNTSIYLTAYSEQAYVDKDFSFKNGVANSDGTAKYEDDFDYDWLIA